MRPGIAMIGALVVLAAQAASGDPASIADAIQKGDLPAIEAYVARPGTDINGNAAGSRSLLNLAVEAHQEAIVEWLVQRGANLNAEDKLVAPFRLVTDTTPESITPLGQAALGDFVDTARYLIAKGARVDGSPGDASTPLGLAAGRGSRKVAELLIAKGARIDGKASDTGTALHVATSNNQAEMVDFLLAHGADPNARNGEGRTPMHLAIFAASIDIATRLAARDADVNARAGASRDGPDPLEMAIQYMAYGRDVESIPVRLLQMGADPRRSLDAGRQLVEEARKKGDGYLANELVFYGAPPEKPGAVAYTPAFLQSPCDIAPMRFEEEAPTIAEVIGDRGHRLAFHPDYPEHCAAGNTRCLGTAFVVAGDRVNVGGQCNAWTDVEFKSNGTTRWGWVETAGLHTLGVSLQGSFSLQHHEPPLTPPPAVCSVEQANLDQGLRSAHPGDPFPVVDLAFKTPDPLPRALATKADPDVDDGDSQTVADAVIDGQPAKIVEVTADGSCSAFDNLQVWTRGFARKVMDSIGDLDEGDTPGQLVRFQGRTYLDRQTAVGRNLYGFGRDLKADLLCKLDIAPTKPERVTTAVDHDLCDAVAAGKVDDIPMDEVKSTEFAAEALRDDSDGSDRARYTLDAKATADLFNDGHPAGFGVVSRYISGFGRCSEDDSSTMAVVLDPQGAPDLAAPRLGIDEADIKLIRYHGAVYVDGRSLDAASPKGEDDKPSDPPIYASHTVWKVDRKGSTLMCSFDTEHYEIQH